MQNDSHFAAQFNWQIFPTKLGLLQKYLHVWTDIKPRFSQSNTANQYRLKRDLINFRQESIIVRSYYNTIIKESLGWITCSHRTQLLHMYCSQNDKEKEAIEQIFQHQKSCFSLESSVHSHKSLRHRPYRWDLTTSSSLVVAYTRNLCHG